MNEVDITIGWLSSCLVYDELDTLEDAIEASGEGEAVTKLDCLEVTLEDVVKVVAYVIGCALAFWIACFEFWF